MTTTFRCSGRNCGETMTGCTYRNTCSSESSTHYFIHSVATLHVDASVQQKTEAGIHQLIISKLDKSGSMYTDENHKYVLITPAKNEEPFIEKTIMSVVKQTVRPTKWVIVDDGSMDRTAEIVSSYLPSHEFIHLVRIRPCMTRDFGRKVAAFNAGLEALGDIPYRFIGNLDADISLPPDYYATILSHFEHEPHLGLAGWMIHMIITNNFMSRHTSSDSVIAGGQFFTLERFLALGGYL